MRRRCQNARELIEQDLEIDRLWQIERVPILCGALQGLRLVEVARLHAEKGDVRSVHPAEARHRGRIILAS